MDALKKNTNSVCMRYSADESARSNILKLFKLVRNAVLKTFYMRYNAEVLVIDAEILAEGSTKHFPN